MRFAWLLLVLAAASATAQIYKWVDEKGKVSAVRGASPRRLSSRIP